VPAQPGWNVLSTEPTGVAVDGRAVPMPDGSTITLIRFRAGQVRFNLHIGTADPPTNGVALPADAGPVISGTEQPLLLAAFNGGFKQNAGAGGVVADGQTLEPLVAGRASFVIGAAGTASIGVWGQTGFPAPTLGVVSVRQNLQPLIHNGVIAPDAGAWADWGATITGASEVGRSAVGEDPAGDIIYAGSMSTYPIDLAQALAGAGATQAMQLDINPYLIQADVASTPGATLTTAVPGQWRASTTYIAGWTRDFVAVLERKATPPQPPDTLPGMA
jgi:hypothetical protein